MKSLENQEPRLPIFLENARHTNAGLGLPDGYFSELTDSVLEKINSENAAEKPLPNFLENLKKQPFALPDRYFENLESRVFEKIEAQPDAATPQFLTSLKNVGEGFARPTDYFETLQNRVFEKIEAEKTGDVLPENVADLKAAEQGFQLPDGYFEELPARVFEKLDARHSLVLPEKTAKTRPISSVFAVLRGRKIWSVAAAAMIFGVAATLFFQEKPAVETACTTSVCLAQSLTDDDVKTYIHENLTDFEADELANEELLATLDAAPKTTKRHEQIQLESGDAEAELKNQLDDLSEEDLEKML